MKKYWILSALCVLFLMLGIVGCTQGEEEAKEAVITGAEDVILKAEDTSYDFSKGVSGTLDGAAAEVAVDSSDVEFGKAGEYEVVYTLGDESVTVKVYIYGMPVLIAEDATQKYSDAVQWTVGVSAKDSFGKDLEVQYTPPQLAVEGMPEYNKAYTVTYTATDAAGNMATKTRTVTVSEDGRPVFEPAEFSLTNVNGSVSVEGDLIAALKDGVEVNPFVQGADGSIFFSGDYFLELGAGEYTFTLVTSAGYNDFVVTVDAGDAMGALEYDDITNYIFTGEELADLPKATSAPSNAYKYSYLYEIVDEDGTAVPVEEFVPSEGNYTYRISAKLSDDDEWTVVDEQAFFLRDTGADVIDLAISPQNINFFRPSYEYGAGISFVESVTIDGDTSPAYRFTTATPTDTDTMPTLGRVLQLDQEFLASMLERGLTTLSMDIGISAYGAPDDPSDVVWIWCEFFGEVPTPEGGAAYSWGSTATGGGLMNEGAWTTINFDLSAGFTSPSQPTIYTVGADGKVTFTFQQFGLCFSVYSVYVGGGAQEFYQGAQDLYIRNIRFGRDTNDTSIQNTYTAGDSTIVLGADGAATVNGANYTYELYKDGTVLFFNDSEQMYEFSMQYTKAGEDGALYAMLTRGGVDYLGEFQFEEGDILSLKDGKVTFELPDYAEQFKSAPGFKYELKKAGGGSVLASQPGSIELTESGAYQWIASFTEDDKTTTLIYDFYVCAEDDISGLLYMKEGEGTIRFVRMDTDGLPVFEVRATSPGTAVLYMDGDYVADMLQQEIEDGKSYPMQISVRPIGNQVYIQWGGQNAVAKPGCYQPIAPDPNGGFVTATVAPSMLAYTGAGDGGQPAFERQGDEDFMLFFNGGDTFEFKGFTYSAS